jgi:Cdc6-like AAA superfamily ATPase
MSECENKNCEKSTPTIIDQHSQTSKSLIALLGDEGVGKKLLFSNICKKLESSDTLNSLKFEIWKNIEG